jgi:colanic acid/amylovoran biosynthesis protein
MIFALYGVNFQNKGAELMLYATKQQIKIWNQNNILACDLLTGTFQQRNSLGVHHLARRTIGRFPQLEKYMTPVAKLIPSFLRKKYQITLDSEVDIIFDASGFAYSDQWGFYASERMASNCLQWKKEKKKIILLPQAFGPFENPRVRNAFITIINNVDLIFARDEISYKYISELPVSLDNVKIAPDFTNLLEPEQPDYINDLIGKVCIVPNQRMLDKTGDGVSNQYLDFLIHAINYLYDLGKTPFILVHETKDIELAKKLQSMIDKAITVVQEQNPLYLKGILGKSDILIGSRFHSLISALSQNVPCIGTGWSHKYKSLFQEYGCSEFLVNFETESIEDNLQKLKILTEETSKHEVINKITISCNKQKKLSIKMWDEVRAVLDS